MFVYAASTILPLVPSFSDECPYGTSVSRLVQRLKKYAERPERRNNPALLKGDEDGSRETHSIAVKALAWLIKTSENPKSTDIALQAIAGAVSYNVVSEERKLLQDLGADKMIARRLIGLVSYSNNYEKTLELYTRARAYCQPPSSESAPASEASGREKAIIGLNGELQRKIRVLRDKLDKGITNYAAGDTFLATTHRMQALKIGNTAASHCLNSLQHGTRAQTEQLFDSAVELIENYRNHTNILHSREAHYLNIGTAMLLVSLLVDCATEIRPQYIMRLLRLAERDPSGQKPLRLEYLSLLLVVYALFQRDYPGWRLQPPLSPTSRAERAIDVITNYVGDSGPAMLSKASSAMINIGLLELLSDPEGYKLKDTDITAITEAFYPIGEGDTHDIHTFPENSPPYTFSLVAKSLATMISKKRKVTESKSVVIGCLTVLNRTVIDQSAADTPLGEAYAFVIECLLELSELGPEAFGQNSALDLLKKFHDLNHREWARREKLTNLAQEWARREKLTNLAQALDERDLFTRLKQAADLATSSTDDKNFVIKLFAIGQVWLLINLAIESEVTDDKDWRRRLNLLIGDESVWDSPDAINALEHDLAEFYRGIFDADGMVRHPYFRTLLLSTNA
ncbi:unnamed protein product [Rhizoctonia solani]|uniref:Uncharacterized protein n=1 Tax=Rhizoctonia solani TaxID=456999 RepID=A0A8H3E121_9AGAM|nr:unnamed protein product [Rhizoctonia solani]